MNWASCTACIWFADMVEKVTPSARLLAMKIPSAPSSSGTEPRIGRAKNSDAATRIRITWM